MLIILSITSEVLAKIYIYSYTLSRAPYIKYRAAQSYMFLIYNKHQQQCRVFCPLLQKS